MSIEEFNELDPSQGFDVIFKCCGSTTWAQRMVDRRPFGDINDVIQQAEVVWASCSDEDVMEAFTHHPIIGDVESLRQKFSSTAEWAGKEQSGVAHANGALLEELAIANKQYVEKFGFIFIICATGQSASAMLDNLKSRMFNDQDVEFRTAMVEQQKITTIRIKKLFA